MKWISLADGVVLTPTIERTLVQVDPIFEGEPSSVTSGQRTAEKQLSIIVEKAKRHGIEDLFPEFNAGLLSAKVVVEDVEIYSWQRAWSKLLSIGDIVNPPLAAVMFWLLCDVRPLCDPTIAFPAEV